MQAATSCAQGKEQGHFSGALEERSGKGQKVSTYRCLIGVHVGVSERRRAIDPEPTAILCKEGEHTKRSSGALEEGSGKGHQVGAQLLRSRTHCSRRDWLRRPNRRRARPRKSAKGEHTKRSSGALVERSSKVQNGSSPHWHSPS
jgi:hypothetical protein